MEMIAKNNFQLFKLEIGYVRRTIYAYFGKNINLWYMIIERLSSSRNLLLWVEVT